MSEGKHERETETRNSQFRRVEPRPKNFLIPAVLVSLRAWNSYGYELAQQMTNFGFEAMNPGTLYRTLRKMERDGAVKSKWETSEGGPARRIYSITDVGEAYLDFWAAGLEQYQRNMDAFFRLYTGGGPQRTNEKKDE